MNNTISDPPLREHASDERDTFDLVNLLRKAANQRYQTTRTVSTTDATPTAIWTSDAMPLLSAWEVEAQVVAIAEDGNAAGYRRIGRFKRQSGASVLVGAVGTPVADSEDVGAWDVTLAISGNGVALSVTGDARAVSWSAFVQVKEARG